MDKVLVDRGQLLTAMEQVQPGLSSREIIDQSSCYIFKNGRVLTYNQEVFCSAKTKLPKDVQGAVNAERIFAFLKKTKKDDLTFEFGEGSLKILGQKEEASFPFQSEVLLPYDDVEAASEWNKLHPDFIDAIGIVQQSASTDQSESVNSCVHITPKFIEATDSVQLCRFRLKTGVPESFLVRSTSIKFISSLPITKIAMTDNSIHFKSDDGLIVSSRLYKENYGDMSTHLKKEGDVIILPKTLNEVMEKAEIFSAVDKDNDYVTFSISQERLVVQATSSAGEYKKVYNNPKYKGPKVSFKVKPKLIREVLRRHTDAEIIDSNILKINGGKYTYMVALNDASSDKKESK